MRTKKNHGKTVCGLTARNCPTRVRTGSPAPGSKEHEPGPSKDPTAHSPTPQVQTQGFLRRMGSRGQGRRGPQGHGKLLVAKAPLQMAMRTGSPGPEHKGRGPGASKGTSAHSPTPQVQAQGFFRRMGSRGQGRKVPQGQPRPWEAAFGQGSTPNGYADW